MRDKKTGNYYNTKEEKKQENNPEKTYNTLEIDTKCFEK